MTREKHRAWLVPLSVPAIDPLEISAAPGGVSLGRAESCQLRLPAEADKVSRQHARFVYSATGWRLGRFGKPLGNVFKRRQTHAATRRSAGRRGLAENGIVEQVDAGPEATREQFGLARVQGAVGSAGEKDVIAAIFDDIVRHAGTSSLQDDATAVMTWSPTG